MRERGEEFEASELGVQALACLVLLRQKRQTSLSLDSKAGCDLSGVKLWIWGFSEGWWLEVEVLPCFCLFTITPAKLTFMAANFANL